MPSSLEIVEVNPTQLEEVLRRVEQALTAEDAALVRAVFQSYVHLIDLVGDKNTSLRRLRQLLFGARTEKTDAVVGRDTEQPDTTVLSDPAARTAETAGEPASGTSNAADREPISRGHGRNGAEAYRGAERIEVPHPSLQAGDSCPACGEGIVYDKAPGGLVRVTGRPPLTAKGYRLPKLLCHLC